MRGLRTTIATLAMALTWSAHASPTSPPSAAERQRPVLLLSPNLSVELRAELSRQALGYGLEVAEVSPDDTISSERYLADLRPLYQSMSFALLDERLANQEQALIQHRVPSPASTRALSEIECWRGAVAVLRGDRARALDYFGLARVLDPNVSPESIFPPQVHKAFASASPGAPVQVALRLAPGDARLWIDGAQVSGRGSVPLAPGLHHVVLERSDRLAVAQLVRVTREGAQIALSLSQGAPDSVALRAASRRLSQGGLGDDEGLGVAGALGRPLWVIEDKPVTTVRYMPGDRTHPVARLAAPPGTGGDPARALLDSLCELGPCKPRPATPSPAPARPLWRRGWFWGAIAGGVVVLGAVAVGAAVGATRPRSYTLQVGTSGLRVEF